MTHLRARASCIAVLAVAAAMATAPAAAQDTRRSGHADMSPALRAMQDDRAQNPALLWVAQGRELWAKREGAAGKACADCHAQATMADAAPRHPAWDAALGRPVTLAQRIALCRQRHQQAAPWPPEQDEPLALQALLADAARGRPITPPVDPRLAPWRAAGAALYAQRLGQLDLACTQCHDQRAGQRLGGSVIPQGHPTGYPIYRLQWQTLGNLPRRLRGCVTGVRAEPWAPDAPEWVQLELHLMQRAAGMVHEGTAVRP